ncbi:MAG: acetyl-CoA carboxylase biotin carboxyl carrier protein subunit [Bdellovibrionales bacterium]|nr:acetyl-CoA carboxylase biotin carboxyl carrier protein subunit [Bdellovibrionales bacterium]
MSKLKKIAITIKNQLFQVKAEELKGRIWFHWKGKIFVLHRSDLSLNPHSAPKTIHINEKKAFEMIGFENAGLKGPSAQRKELKSDGKIKADGYKHLILSPMPGEIVKIRVRPGQEVADGYKHLILSPMPGEIVKIRVRPGQEVKENQTVLVLSSMKMEYTVKAPDKGFIKLVKVKEGDRVSADQELVEMTKSLK